MTLSFRFVVAAALAAGSIAACVGDSPSGAEGSSSGSAASDASTKPDALTSGGPPGSSSGVTNDDGGLRDADVPTGTVGWGTHFDTSGDPAQNGIAADSRAGRRLFARSLDVDGGSSTSVRVEWLAADGTIAASKVFTSTKPVRATGVRLDNAGNAYLSIEFQAPLSSAGDPDIAAPADAGGITPAGIKCAILRLDADGASVRWSKSFYVSGVGSPGGDDYRQARCKVARVSNEGALPDNRVVVTGTFTEAALYSGSPAAVVATSRAHTASTILSHDGFVAVLATETGEKKVLESFGAENPSSNSNDVDVYDATFASSTKVVVVGSTDSPTVSRGATAQILASAPAAGYDDQSRHALVLTVDLLDPAGSIGEAWPVASTGNTVADKSRFAEATAIAGTGGSLVVMGQARSAPVTSTLTVPNAAAIPLGSIGRYFAVGISATGRVAYTHEPPTIGAQAAVRMDDGRVVLATTSATGVDFGPGCQLPGTAGVGTTLAFFTDPTLTTCTHAVAFPNALPLGLSGGGAMALLTGYTSSAVDFGAYTVPVAAVPQGFAVEVAP